ncbi:AzlD domain-containing protein [Amaricoccus solimangrovi]|uniref:AzlD domain-containing protein n=1 Tax=Amaricoccus solimangrovi TaxID=2589815 RepID=A0A501WJ38_9RHOB|nr:AzlD domain-containing protein [Amaricoccus solimangrovi]TPE49358.1 AzlD domain-containing protein [Amaricoccus solimangrovi]
MSMDARIWTVIALLGIGTYLIRLSFLGMIGDRALPLWATRLLRYVPVAVMPGLVAPLVVWPPATDGALDMPRLLAALAALLVGAWKRNALWAIGAGMAVLYAGLFAQSLLG